MMGRIVTALVLSLTVAGGTALAQTTDTFSGRLRPVPVSLAQLSGGGGSGTVTATLSGRRLSINGTYAGLPATATLARLHQGVATGASGPAFADLNIINSGTVTLTAAHAGRVVGEVELNREQREALLAGHLYIQLHAETGVEPDNAVLRGWLLARPTDQPQAARR
jgi:hypothetical protein